MSLWERIAGTGRKAFNDAGFDVKIKIDGDIGGTRVVQTQEKIYDGPVDGSPVQSPHYSLAVGGGANVSGNMHYEERVVVDQAEFRVDVKSIDFQFRRVPSQPTLPTSHVSVAPSIPSYHQQPMPQTPPKSRRFSRWLGGNS